MGSLRALVTRMLAGIALSAGLHTLPSSAMMFSTVPIDQGIAVVGIGPIMQGDRVKLVALLDGLPFTTPAKALLLDSPGGSVIEAERLAGTIRSSRLPVGVMDGSMCASACFLLFAAAPRKLVQVGARIGVHSASIDASEDVSTMAMTTAMARDAAAYGVPSGIIGRMVTTEPGQMAWLSGDELYAMGAAIVPGESRAQALQPPPPLPIPNSVQSATTAGSGAASSLAFQQGLVDRKSWEGWFASLTPFAHAGALYWSAQRSLRQPGSCLISPPNLSPDDRFEWCQGCIDAQRHLNLSDKRRKTDSDYRAGWNSL